MKIKMLTDKKGVNDGEVQATLFKKKMPVHFFLLEFLKLEGEDPV